MAGLSFSGLGSGVDFNLIKESIVNQRRRPIQLLESNRGKINGKIDALRQLNTLLGTLTKASEDMKVSTLGTGRVAFSSAGTIVGATATAEATPAVLNVNVTRLATQYTEKSGTYAAKTTAVSAAITADPTKTVTIELYKGGAATGKTVTLTSANNTLEGLQTAINGVSGGGVNASIVDVTGAGDYRLVLTSSDTGAANRVTLVETTAGGDTGTVTSLGMTMVNPVSGNVSDLDASFTVNGLSLTRAKNDVTDVVTGVTLNLKTTGSASIEVRANTAEINNKLQTFVSAYNAVYDFVQSHYVADSSGRPKGVLAGDKTLSYVSRSMAEAINQTSTLNGGIYTNLAEIGVGRDSTGRLSLDYATLDSKIKSNFSDVQALLFGKTTSDTGVFETVYDNYYSMSDALNGGVASAITSYQNSIKTIDKSISAQESRISMLEETLTRQFAAVDSAISSMNSQGTALSNIFDSLNNSKRK